MTDAKVYECDEELSKQSNGDKFFVDYGEGTKLQTFKTEEQANNFVDWLKRGNEPKEIDIWLVVFQGIPQVAFDSEIACEKFLIKEGTSMKVLDDEDHEGNWEYYNIDLHREQE